MVQRLGLHLRPVVVKVKKADTGQFIFQCPGCGFAHWFGPPRWTWNGDYDKPTVNPSIVTVGVEPKCHSFIRDGKIQFLNDCTHALKGQTVEIPDWEG